jgi:uncharacterized protein involved in exopolysaccharide biosynthesis/Mrp family chromosome partitioning ATPase
MAKRLDSQTQETRTPSLRPVPFSPRDVLYVVFRHRGKAMIAFALVATLALAAALLLPPKYVSEATLKVAFGRESMSVRPEATIGKTVAPTQSRDIELNSELEMLYSRELARAVAERVGLDRLPGGGDGLDEAADSLQKDVAASLVPKTDNLKIAYSADESQLAHDVVAAYVEEFMALRIRVRRGAGGPDFFAEQQERKEIELQEARQALRELKDRTGIADVGTQRTILLQRIGDLEAQADAARAAMAGARATADRLATRLDEMPETVVTQRIVGGANSSVEELRGRLAQLRLQESELVSTYVEDSPTVVSVRRQITEAETMLKDAEALAEETTGVNPIRSAMALNVEEQQAAAKAQAAKLDRLAADLADARTGLAELNEVQVRVEELERRAAIAEEAVRQYANTAEIARIDRELEAQQISNVSVQDPATLPRTPDGPNRKLLALVGLMMATLAAAGTGFVADAIDHTIGRPDDLRRVASTVAPAAGVATAAAADACVSVPRLRSGQAEAKGAAEYFDDLTHAVARFFGLASRRSSSVAAGTSRSARGVVRATTYITTSAIASSVRGLARLASAGLERVGSAGSRAASAVRPARATRVMQDGPGLALAGPLVAEYEALQDEDVETEVDLEPKAEPDRRVGRSLRLLAWSVRRDAAAYLRRDERPNLQLSSRDSRTAAADAVWRSSRGLLEQLLMTHESGDGYGRPPVSIAVLAARPRSGASTVATHLAGVLAERADEDRQAGRETAGGGVLLLRVLEGSTTSDTDLPEPDATPVEGLFACNLTTVRTGDVRRALDAAAERFQHVVLDLPPVFADLLQRGSRAASEGVREEAGPRLAALAEVTVIVLEADGIRREAAGRALERLTRAGATVAASVLNKRSYPVPQWIYSRV